MREVVPCGKCANCAIGYGTGFTGEKLMHCSKLNDYVTDDDGCTMGEEGEPGALCVACDVTVAGHESVYGW